MLDLVELFASLEIPFQEDTDGNRFSAAAIAKGKQHRLGKDIQGRPVILFSATTASNRRFPPPPIVLEHITILHDIDCQIIGLEGKTDQGKFTLVRCTSDDTVLHTYFLRMASSIVSSFTEKPLQKDISIAIAQLVELFRAMSKPSRKSIQGLWAELFLISQAKIPNILVRAWHSEPEDRYDFCFLDTRLEVKSVSTRKRQHHFSFEQLHPPTGIDVLVASLFVERNQAGMSIEDLSKNIRHRLGKDIELVLHFDQVISFSLGESWKVGLCKYFSVKRSRAFQNHG